MESSDLKERLGLAFERIELVTELNTKRWRPKLEAPEDPYKPKIINARKSEKILDTRNSHFGRAVVNCNFCGKEITKDEGYVFRKASARGAKYYSIECSRKAGFDIEIPKGDSQS